MSGPQRAKVLVVDDSALVREAWRDVIDGCTDLELIGTAGDPYAAAQKMRRIRPDVLVLDIEMPKMDGLTFLKRLMAQHPLPVVICSGLADRSREAAFQALRLGALEIVPKHSLTASNESKQLAVRAIRSALQSRGAIDGPKLASLSPPPEPKRDADAVMPSFKPERAHQGHGAPIIAIGASTGGTEALAEMLRPLDLGCTGIVVVQHMPEQFTSAFAQRLDRELALDVVEGEKGQRVQPGQVIIAPGRCHMTVQRGAGGYVVQLRDGPPVNRHRPAVDVLFRSVAMAAGSNALGIILTGMGADGAQGLLELKQVGAKTIAQDEESSVVFGMPKEAIALGGAREVLALQKMPAVLSQFRRG